MIWNVDDGCSVWSEMILRVFSRSLPDTYKLKPNKLNPQFWVFISFQSLRERENVILQKQANKQGSFENKRNTMEDKVVSGSIFFSLKKTNQSFLLNTAREKGLTNISTGHGSPHIGLKELRVIP